VSEPTYVLIHGAWHGGWCWRPVVRDLRAGGARVVAPTLPGFANDDDPQGFSLAEVADSVVDLIERHDLTDVVLVGHSWAGYVLAAVAPRVRARLRRVVFWSAFVPAADASLLDELDDGTRALFRDLATASPDDTITLPYEVWQAIFVQDATPELQKVTYDLLVPQPFRYSATAVAPLDAGFDVPMTYLMGEADLTMPQDETGWTRMAARLGLVPELIPGSHELCFTDPAALTKVLGDVGRRVG
jgi:pimeloyl-ACP methyl ester carboxylesterase